MPDAAYPAFREALAAMREGVLIGEQGGAARLKRRMVERVLGACADERGEATAPLLALLRRFAVEAAREEARLFCDDLVAEAASAADQSSRDAQLSGLARLSQASIRATIDRALERRAPRAGR